jgi:signal recognition particle subunit SRP54
MFDTLTERLDGVFSKLRKRGKLHPKQVDNALADVRTALLEADVAVEVADDLLNRVRSRALSEEVLKSLSPAQQVVKVMNEELTVTLGGEHRPFTLPGAPPVVVLLAGVQGSGKTTASAKLAKYLKSKGRRPLLVGADLDRPAAVEQLRTLGREIGVPVWSEGRDPVKLAKNGVREAERTGADVVIVDTAGRLHTQDHLMAELTKVRRVIGKQLEGAPHETLLTIDATTGQNGVRQAQLFSEAVPVDGIVLTKLDGTAKGGIALAIAGELGIPVKLIGIGEALEDLRPFDADDYARALLT